MKLVVISDLHAHYWKAFSAGHNSQGTRFLRTLQVLRNSLQAARENDCPWAFAGDWVHTIGWSHNAIVTHLIRLLQEYKDVEKVTIWGNHDARTHGDEIKKSETVVEVLAQSVPKLELLNGSLCQLKNGLRIWGEGYQPDRKFLKIPGLTLEGCHVGLFHQTVSGTKLASGHELGGGSSGLTKEELFKAFRLSIVGDVHHPQAFIEGQRVILIPGSPEHHNFGDVGDHGWWLCQLLAADVQCVMVPSGSPQFLTVSTIDEVKDDQNFYRVLTPCDPRLYQDRAVQVVAPPPTTIPERSLIKEGADIREILNAWLSLTPEIVDKDEYLKVGTELLVDEGLVTMRAVRLEQVKLKGFMCFTDETFDLEAGITLVTGEARDYESNGAGKTTLFESIFWVLFGRTTKGVGADEVIQYGAQQAEVSLLIRDGEKSITVCRTRRRGEGGQLHVYSEGKEWGGGTADLTKQLGQYLGITPDLFQALTYFSQSKLVLFSQASDSERKGMLSDLCGLSAFQNASAEARGRAQECDRRIVLLEQKINGFTDELQHAHDMIKDGLLRQSQWTGEHGVRIESLKSELGRLERTLPECDVDLEMTLTSIDLKFKTHFQNVEGVRLARKGVLEQELKTKIEWARDRYNEILAATPEEARTGSAYWEGVREEFDALRGEAWMRESGIRAQLGMKDQEMKVALDLKSTCPTCGQDIDESTHRAHLDLLSREVGTFKTELEKVQAEVKEKAERVALASRMQKVAVVFENATRDRDLRLDQYTRDLENAEQIVTAEIQESVADLRQQKALEEQKAKSVAAERRNQNTTRQSEIHQRLQDIEAEVDPYVDLIQKASDRVDLLENQAQATSAEIAASHRQAATLGYWAKGLSRSGVQSILLEGVAASFNQIRSRIFPLLTRGIYDVQFSTISETAEGEAREKTAFIIRDRDALVSYESLSGGQRRRIDLGVMLTLALAVSSTRRVPGVLGMMILDEVFGFLDSDGVEALYETLGEVEKVIPSIYAITHDPDLQSLFGHTMMVRQDEHGVSHLIAQPSVGE